MYIYLLKRGYKARQNIYSLFWCKVPLQVNPQKAKTYLLTYTVLSKIENVLYEYTGMNTTNKNRQNIMALFVHTIFTVRFQRPFSQAMSSCVTSVQCKMSKV